MGYCQITLATSYSHCPAHSVRLVTQADEDGQSHSTWSASVMEATPALASGEVNSRNEIKTRWIRELLEYPAGFSNKQQYYDEGKNLKRAKNVFVEIGVTSCLPLSDDLNSAVHPRISGWRFTHCFKTTDHH